MLEVDTARHHWSAISRLENMSVYRQVLSSEIWNRNVYVVNKYIFYRKRSLLTLDLRCGYKRRICTPAGLQRLGLHTKLTRIGSILARYVPPIFWSVSLAVDGTPPVSSAGVAMGALPPTSLFGAGATGFDTGAGCGSTTSDGNSSCSCSNDHI